MKPFSNQFKVYHTKDFRLNTMLMFSDNPKPNFKDYKLVASVNCEDLETAYMLTNHIDSEWWNSDRVACVEKSRSTSVGDIIEDFEGNRFMVASLGFTRL